MTLLPSWLLYFLQQVPSNWRNSIFLGNWNYGCSLQRTSRIHCISSHQSFFILYVRLSVNPPNIPLQIEQKLWRFLSSNFPKLSITSSRLPLNSLVRILSSTLSIFCSLNITDQVSHPRKQQLCDAYSVQLLYRKFWPGKNFTLNEELQQNSSLITSNPNYKTDYKNFFHKVM